MSKLEQVLKSQKTPTTLDDLSSKAGTSGPETQAALTMLELSGKVKSSGGRYEWIRKAKAPPKPVKARAPRKITTATVQTRGRSNGKFGSSSQTDYSDAVKIVVVSHRWKDRKTGRWLPNPRVSYAARRSALKVRKLKGEQRDTMDDGVDVYRTFTKSRYGQKPRKYRAEFPEARVAYAKGELSKEALLELEQSIAEGIFEQDLEDYNRHATKLELDNRHRTGAAGKRDTTRKMTKRPKLLNSKNTKTPDQLRTEKIRLESKGRELTRKILSARAPKSRATLETQYANNTRRLVELQDKAKRQGVNL